MKTHLRLEYLAVAALAAAIAFSAAPALAGHDHAHDKSAKSEAKADLPEGQVRTVIPVSGMTCSGCASAINVAVKKLDGVVDVAVNADEGNAAVTYVKKKVTVAEIVKAINKTGFKATEPKEGEDS